MKTDYLVVLVGLAGLVVVVFLVVLGLDFTLDALEAMARDYILRVVEQGR